MLISLREIHNYRLQALDGDFGEIQGFLIDDQDWVLRYIIVGVGSRSIMLSVISLGQPDIVSRVIPVNVTREKIMNSPDIDASKPLARDIERQLSDYYEWPYYWDPDEIPNTLPGDLTAIPLIDLQVDREAQEAMEQIPQTGENASSFQNLYHLHSTRTLFGETIHATNDDRDAGKLVDIVTQNEDWSVLYLVVETGGLFNNHKVLVSPSWVGQIDELDGRMDVDLTAETIENSPDFNTIEEITDEYQTRLRDYYGQR